MPGFLGRIVCIELVLLVGAALFAAGCSEAPGQDGSSVGGVCGDLRLTTARQAIVNGTNDWDDAVVDLSPGQALAVGAVMTRGRRNFSNTCTGTLVAPSVVVTAAHCVEGGGGGTLDPEDVAFAIGADADTAPLVLVDEVAMHPGYDPFGDAEHDVSVLVLAQPAAEVVPGVLPIPYNCDPLSSGTLVGETVQTVGYGCTDTDCFDDNTERYWALEEAVSVSSFDFVLDGDGVQGVCYGDSGGPALWTTPSGVVRTLGTLSWGDAECGNRDHFASTNDHCDFLDAYVDTPDPDPDPDPDPAPDVGGTPDAGSDMGGNVDAGPDPTPDAGGGDDAGPEPDLGGGTDTDPGGDTTGQPSECGTVTYGGYCDGETAVWCEGGEVRRRRCDLCGEQCGWVRALDGYYCY